MAAPKLRPSLGGWTFDQNGYSREFVEAKVGQGSFDQEAGVRSGGKVPSRGSVEEG